VLGGKIEEMWNLLKVNHDVSQNQPAALLEFAVHLSVYGKVYSRPNAIVAYTNNDYLRGT
jgi:hypothetical protein